MQLIRAAQLIDEARRQVELVVNSMSTQWDGASDYTVIESQYGIAAGKGAVLLSLFTNLQSVLNSNATIAGADRLSFLDTVVATLTPQ